MSNGNHGLRFDIYERVHLPENVAAIDELEEIELVPRIQVIEQGENAVLQGQLVLNGIYRAQGERDEQVALEHWIPVEITLPMNRVTRLDEITVDIDTFDVVLLSSRALNLTGILSLRGIMLEQDEEADGWNAEVFTVSHSRGEEESAEYSATDFQGQTEQQEETEYRNETDYLNQSAYQGEAEYRGEEVYQVSAEQQSEAYYYAEAEQQAETFHVYAYAEQDQSQQYAAQSEQYGYEAEGYRNEQQQEEQINANYAAQPEQQHYSFLQQLGQKYAQSAEELNTQGEQAEYLYRAAEYNIEQQGNIEAAQYEQHEHIEAAYSEAEQHAAYVREEGQDQHEAYAREEEQDQYAQQASDTAHTPDHEAVQWSAWEAAEEEQAEREQEDNDEQEAEELDSQESQHMQHAEQTAERELHIALNGNTAQNETQGIRTILNSSLREQAAQQAATLQQQELDRKQAEEEKQRTTDDEIEWQQLFLNKRPEQNEFKRIRMCIVQKEDTLEQIALRYSINPRDLLIRNNLHESAITEGQLLYIP